MIEIKNSKQSAWRCAAFLSLCFTANAAFAAAGGMYKWTDDQGVVHYSDQMPPDATNKGSVVLDKQGRPLKKIDPALTPAQLKAKEAEDERARVEAKLQEDKARRDLALIHSYTSEEEIDFARNRALSAIESQLKSAEEFTGDLAKRQQELQKQKLAYAGKPAPVAFDNELAAVDEELARQAKVLAQRKADLSTISAKYENDKQRWREIKAEQQKPAPGQVTAMPPASATATAKSLSTTSNISK